MTRKVTRLIAAGLLSSVALAQEAPKEAQDNFKWGGDLRLRETAFDNIPIIADPPGITRGGENNFFRIRSRIWGSFAWEKMTVSGRMTHEFRKYIEPDTPSSTDWPDEAIVDQLYVDLKGLMDGVVDVRVGRQDLIYGAGRVILEGTTLDGSRTIYFDAAKVSLHLGDDATIDLLGIYNGPEAELEVGGLDRDVTGFDKYSNDMVESGGGVYAKIKSIQDMPCEVYYLFKDESKWKSMVAGDPPSPITKPGRQTHTIGARLLPKLNEQIGFEFEGAAQFGETDDDRDISGYMGYGGAIWTLPMEIAKAKPTLTASLYYLSGDDPDTTDKDEGWNPLWARYPQFSELYIYAFDYEKAAYWSNVLYPSLTAAVTFDKFHKFSISAGMLYAPEENGPGGGDRRGNLFTARYDFPIVSKLLTESDRIYGHVIAEVLDPGDYYMVDDTAYFLRWELVYSF
jgi:hypothetical protein